MDVVTRDPIVVTPPEVEPVLLSEAVEHLRLDSLDEEAWLNRAIRAAREHVEAFTGRALITQTLEVALEGWPGATLALPRPPLASVTSIKYFDQAGVEATVSSGDYLVDTRSTPGRVLLRTPASWPGVTLQAANGVVVRYVAGYGDEPEDVPAAMRQAILLLVGHLYENREATLTGTIVTTMPFGVERLLWPYRVF